MIRAGVDLRAKTRLTGRSLAAAAIGLVWLALAAPFLFAAVNPFVRDTAILYLPLRVYFAERLHKGHLPAWFPNDRLGEAFIGQVVTATFHPQGLLYLVFPPLLALKWNLYLCVLAGYAGAYRMARALGASRAASWGAGSGYALCGYSLSMLNNLPYLCGVATLPWAAWAALRFLQKRQGRHVALLGVFWSLLFLGGDAQAALMLAPFLLVAWGAGSGTRRAILGIAIAGGLSVLISAVELGPALGVAQTSERASWRGDPGAMSQWAFLPWRFPDLIAAGTASDVLLAKAEERFQNEHGRWARSVFLGALAAFAAVCGLLPGDEGRRRKRLAFGALALMAFWMSTGAGGGLLVLVLRVCPVIGWFRFPEKYLALFSLALVPLTAAGFDWIGRNGRKAAWGAIAGAVLLAVVGTACARLSLPGGLETLEVPVKQGMERLVDSWASGLGASAVALFVAGTLLLLVVAARRSTVVIFPALATLELLHAGVSIFPSIPDSTFLDGNRLAAPVRAAAELPVPAPRLASNAKPFVSFHSSRTEEDFLQAHLSTISPSTGVLYGVEQFGGNLPGLQQRYSAVLGKVAPAAVGLAPSFNGCFLLSSDDAPPPSDGTALATDSDRGLILYRRSCTPRASLVEARSAPDMASAVQALQSGLPPGVIVWEGAAARARSSGEVRWLEAEPENLRLEVEASQPAALFVADAYAPGWTAEVDGRPAVIHPADVAARGVEVPAGRHEVAMHYRVPHLMAGAWATALGLLLALGLCLIPGRFAQRLW